MASTCCGAPSTGVVSARRLDPSGSSETTLAVSRPSTSSGASGQATVEYFLVILAATALAIIALKWLQSGSGSGLLGQLFSKVISWVAGAF